MDVTLRAIPAAEKATAWRLLQLCLSDLSAFDRRAPDATGEFAYPYFDAYWDAAELAIERRMPFFIELDGALAGFVLVREFPDGRRQIAEFYVVRAFRTRGVGRHTAREVFARFPGPWDLTVHPRNAPDQRFWRTVIAEAGATEWQASASPFVVRHQFVVPSEMAAGSDLQPARPPAHIRPATEADLPRIQAIYNDAILTTTATWDETPWPWEQRIDWWREHAADPTAPVVVAEADDAAVAGFAYLSWYRPKAGYRFTRESTVYVDPAYHRRGLGYALVETLISEARGLGLRALLAVIDASNEPSLVLHRQLGFIEVAYEREIGYKFDRWLDCVTMELLIARSEVRGARSE